MLRNFLLIALISTSLCAKSHEIDFFDELNCVGDAIGSPLTFGNRDEIGFSCPLEVAAENLVIKVEFFRRGSLGLVSNVRSFCFYFDGATDIPEFCDAVRLLYRDGTTLVVSFFQLLRPSDGDGVSTK